MDKKDSNSRARMQPDQRAWERFDQWAAQVAEAYAPVPEAEGIAEIDRIAAEVRGEMRAERRKARN